MIVALECMNALWSQGWRISRWLTHQRLGPCSQGAEPCWRWRKMANLRGVCHHADQLH